MDIKKIAIVGAGPKAASLVAKAFVLNKLDMGRLEIDLFEEHEIAANWDGQYGHTDGQQKLGTPPEKDIGFPYESIFGEQVDKELFQFSWESYLIAKKLYGSYVDRGKPHPFHEEWASYLRWVCSKAKANIKINRVVKLDLIENDKFRVFYLIKGEEKEEVYDGVVFTGPGKPLKVGNKGHEWIHSKVIDGQQYWSNIPIFRELSDDRRVAIIGAGETAASIAVSLTRNCPNINIEIINRTGVLYTRGESFYENEIYTNPERWEDLDEVERLEFIRRTDRGVFSVEAKKEIDQSTRIKTITGTVIGIERDGKNVVVELERINQKKEYIYDIVVVAIGFDPLWPLDILAEDKRPNFPTVNRHRRQSTQKLASNIIDEFLRVPLPLVEGGKYVNLHLPMLSGLKQCPGFPNLSCLGHVSDRIISAYISPQANNSMQPTASASAD